MDFSGIARAVHVVAVVVWIGGVAFITAVVLPTARSNADPAQGYRLFDSVERRFARIARAMLLLVAASGVYMIWSLDLWSRFEDRTFWWMHAMAVLWFVFAIMLFAAEPLFQSGIKRLSAARPRRLLDGMLWLHWILLIAAVVTIAGAVAGAHGYQLF